MCAVLHLQQLLRITTFPILDKQKGRWMCDMTLRTLKAYINLTI
jgi:hypothetical protein